jgi:ribose/xylose/arabinose/galactoside ABC-type transport system permease subunit
MTSSSTAPTPTEPAVSSERRRMPSLATLRNYGVIAFLVALFIGLSLGTDTFLTVSNLKNVLDGAVPVGLIACAGTIVLMAGGFDLSAGAIFAVSAIVGAKVSNDLSPIVGIVAGILTGCGLGTGQRAPVHRRSHQPLRRHAGHDDRLRRNGGRAERFGADPHL